MSLEDIKEPGEIKTKGAKVTTFSILSTKRKTITAVKRKMSYEIKDEFRIFGIQSFELFEKLNQINIQIRDSKILFHYNKSVIELVNRARYKCFFFMCNV